MENENTNPSDMEFERYYTILRECENYIHGRHYLPNNAVFVKRAAGLYLQHIIFFESEFARECSNRQLAWQMLMVCDLFNKRAPTVQRCRFVLDGAAYNTNTEFRDYAVNTKKKLSTARGNVEFFAGRIPYYSSCAGAPPTAPEMTDDLRETVARCDYFFEEFSMYRKNLKTLLRYKEQHTFFTAEAAKYESRWCAVGRILRTAPAVVAELPPDCLRAVGEFVGADFLESVREEVILRRYIPTLSALRRILERKSLPRLRGICRWTIFFYNSDFSENRPNFSRAEMVDLIMDKVAEFKLQKCYNVMKNVILW